MLRDINRQKVTRQRLEYMFLRWEVGDDWDDYGVEAMSRADGARYPAFYDMVEAMWDEYISFSKPKTGKENDWTREARRRKKRVKTLVTG